MREILAILLVLALATTSDAAPKEWTPNERAVITAEVRKALPSWRPEDTDSMLAQSRNVLGTMSNHYVTGDGAAVVEIVAGRTIRINGVDPFEERVSLSTYGDNSPIVRGDKNVVNSPMTAHYSLSASLALTVSLAATIGLYQWAKRRRRRK